MDPEDLVGVEVVAVKKYHDYLMIIFDNGYEVEVPVPSGSSFEDVIHECGE